MFSELGPYRVLSEKPSSYSGVVYEALDRIHHRKVLLTECPSELPAEEVLERLEDTAREFTLLNHPSIARPIGFIRRDNIVYFVTENVGGCTLEEILNERGRLPQELAISLFRQIMAGLIASHRAGVIHGDLKPANIAVPDFGPVKILNLAFEHAFGSASAVHDPSESRYVSPEQTEGHAPDARSDIYSLGLMLYQAIVGRNPFDEYGESMAEAAAQGQFIPMSPSLILDDVPDSLDQLLLRMIAPDPANRFQSMQEVMQFLDSRLAIKTSAKHREVNPNKAISDPISRVNGRVRGSLQPTAIAARSNWQGCLTLFERACANGSARLSDFLNTYNGAASKLWMETRESLQSVASRSSVKAAGLLFLIAAEVFYFSGAHISLLLDAALPPRASLSDSVDAMFARLDRESPTRLQSPSPRKHAMSQPNQAAVARKVDRRSPTDAKNAISSTNEISPVKETESVRSMSRISEPSKHVPVSAPSTRITVESTTDQTTGILETAHVSNRKEPEPAEPVKTAQNIVPNPRLKVEWEN